MFKNIKLEKEGGLATVTIDRPEKLNILNREIFNGLIGAAENISQDANTRVVVITGAGDRAFSAGVDVHEMKDLDVTKAKEFISLVHRAIKSFRELDSVVIAAINGFCLGGSLELAMACDIRIASENAQLGLPEIQVGIPSVIEAVLMPLLMGTGRAREMILLGDPISAIEAERVGLVNKVVPADKLKSTVREITDRLLSYSPTTLKWQKRILKRWLPQDMEAAIDYSIEAFGQCYATGEPREAMNALLEKRKPNFGKKG